VDGTEVSPRRALEAFWRCEHTFERMTRDIVVCRPDETELAAQKGTKT
jgi:hypothetical protein